MLTPRNPPAAFENRLLAALLRKDYERLGPHLEHVRLVQGKILYGASDTIRYAYFLTGGMVSLLSISEDGRTIEVGAVGKEGMVGIPSVLGFDTSPYLVMVQLPCTAMRVRADVLKGEFGRGGHVQSLLLRFTHTLLTQISQSAACNAFHRVEERLCRWLLASHDRAQSDTFQLTQEFLAQMMGVPRTSVTMIAGKLQRAGLISYRRGRIRIIDRQGLELTSCECYRIIGQGIRELVAA